MKGQVTEIIEVIFAIGISTILLVTLLPKIGQPAWQTYGKDQADTIAQSIAISINALATSDAGVIKKTFDGLWDVEIFTKDGNRWIKIRHEEIKSDPIKIFATIKNVEENSPLQLSGVKAIEITKVAGQPIEVRSI
jgi:hypothetical protein